MTVDSEKCVLGARSSTGEASPEKRVPLMVGSPTSCHAPKTSLVSQLGGRPVQTSKAPFQDSDSRSVCAYGRLTPTTRLASYLLRRRYANVYGFPVRAASRREGLARQDSQTRQRWKSCGVFLHICFTKQDERSGDLAIDYHFKPISFGMLCVGSIFDDPSQVRRCIAV